MTDKVQKIREEIARIQLYTQSEVLKQILDYIDEVQKEPVSEDLEKAINDAMPHRYCWSGDGKPVYTKEQMKEFFKTGVQWQKKQFE